MKVADLAALVGTSADTIRYYERAGLLPPADRTPSGYRAYGPEAAERLRFIRGAQRLGLRLREITELLAVRDTGECPCEPAEQLLRRRRDEIDREIERLVALRSEIERMLDASLAGVCAEPVPGTWCAPEGGDDECSNC